MVALVPWMPLVLSLTLAAPPSAQEAVPPLPRFELPANGISVPLLDWGGRPVVVARCGDTELRLIVDTGSSPALVLGREPATVDELWIGAARLVRPPVTRIAFPLVPPGSGERIDGILGSGALHGVLLVLDFGERRLELQHGAVPAGDADAVSLRLDDGSGGLDDLRGIPTLEVRAGDYDFEAHLDTGSPELLLVPSDLAVFLPQQGEPRPVGMARTPMGDARISEVGLVGAIEVGPLRVEPARFRIGDLPQIAGRGLGNVGARLFGKSRLTLDLASRRLRIEPPGRTRPPLAELLTRMVGDFDVVAQLRIGDTEEFREVTGRASFAPAAAGSWKREAFELDDPVRGRHAGSTFLGTTAAPGCVEALQIDGHHASALHLFGRWSEPERAVVLDSVLPRDPSAGLSAPTLRWIFRPLEGAGFVKELYREGRDGVPRLDSTCRYLPRS